MADTDMARIRPKAEPRPKQGNCTMNPSAAFTVCCRIKKRSLGDMRLTKAKRRRGALRPRIGYPSIQCSELPGRMSSAGVFQWASGGIVIRNLRRIRRRDTFGDCFWCAAPAFLSLTSLGSCPRVQLRHEAFRIRIPRCRGVHATRPSRRLRTGSFGGEAGPVLRRSDLIIGFDLADCRPGRILRICRWRRSRMSDWSC